MEEIWKDIIGYEGYYKISNTGLVKSLAREIPNGNPILADKILSIQLSLGYNTVKLCKNHKSKRVTIHRMIAIHFIPNPDRKPCINHINGIRNDNRIENLEWVTYYENHTHKVVVLKHGYNKLNKSQWSQIFIDKKEGLNQRELSEKYNIDPSTISRILSNKRYRFFNVNNS